MKEISILGQKYTINEVNCVCKDEPMKSSIDYLTHEIRIDRSMPVDLKQQTLLHEILRAMCDALGMYELAEDERSIQSLATALYSLFGTQIGDAFSSLR